MSECPNSLQKLLGFLVNLDERHIAFTLRRCRNEAIMVFIDVPGERWEIEFFADGTIEVEVFRSDGKISGEESLETLFLKFSD